MSKQYKDILEEIQAINAKHGINISREKAQNMINNVQQVNLRDTSKKRNNWINTGAFDDGYQVGDITKSIIGTYEDFGNQFSKGVFSTSEGIADLGLNLISGAVEPFNKNKAEEIRKYTTHNFTEEAFVNSAEGEKNSLLGTYLQGAAQGEGNLAVQIATKEAGIPWQFTAFASSAGNEMNNAFSNNASFGKALMSGIISGAVEVGSEYIGGGANKVLGMTSLGSKALEKLGGKISNKLAAKLLNIGIDAAGEGLEEIVSGIGTAIGQRLTYMDKDNLNKLLNNEKSLDEFITDTIKNVTKGISEYWSTDAKQDFIAGSLTGLSGSGGQLIQNSNRNAFNGLTDNEKSIFDKEYERIIAEQEKDGNKLSNKEKDKIYDRVKEDLERGYIDTKTIEDALGYNEGYNKLKTDTENAIGRPVTTTEDADIKAEARERFFKSIEKDDYLLRSYEENAKAGQKFNVSEEDMKKMSDAEKKIYQKAMDSELNNQGRTHDFVKMVAKISADKGIDFDFSNNEKIANSSFALKNLETKINNMIEEKQNKLGRPLTENEVKDIRLQVASMVNGFENNGTITLNMNSSKTLSKVMGHEITHILEGTDMYDALAESVREYAKSKNDARLKDISDFNKMYSDVENANLSKELTADLVGDYIFTDQEFVNRLSTQNRNLFQKIFDEIKYMLRIATAGSKEARQLEKAKKMFEEAYRQNSVKAAEQQNAASPKYSIAGINGINNLSDSKFKTKALEKYKEAQKMAKNNEDNETIRQETRWFKDKNGDWKFEVNDRDVLNDVKLNIDNLKPNTEISLDKVFNHNMLFKLYPNLKNITVKFQDAKKGVKGSYNNKGNYIRINNELIENEDYKELKGVILHELQHAIQYAEGFETGSSSKLSKKAYYNSLGEIEARDTQNRYLEGFDKVDRYLNAPESSKANPKHADYDKYMENRKTVDKIKDAIYPLFEGAIKNAKNNQIIDNKDTIQDNRLVNGGINESNTRFSLSQDNQGRELSKEQQEYFKDSKARDENGNLEVVYHGTNNAGFNIFSRNFNYYTDNQDIAQSYTGGTENASFKRLESVNDAKSWLKGVDEDLYIEGNNVYDISGDTILEYDTAEDLMRNLQYDIQKEYGNTNAGGYYEGYVNITNPLIIDVKGDKWSGIDIDNIDVENPKEFLEKYGSSTFKENGAIRTSTNDIVSAVLDAIDEGKMNYDGVIFKNIIDEGNYSNNSNNTVLANDYITFNSNQFKNVNNTTPTSDPDIRYSLSETGKTTDSNGNELTKEQLEYFKDSKVLDNNGNLKVMYHGTPTGGFNIFEFNHPQRDVGFLGKGFYFTSDAEAADEYSKSFDIYDYTPNSEVKEVYLNIKNPYIIPTEVDYTSDMLAKRLGVRPEQIQRTLINQGYDGIIYDDNWHNEYVVFDSNQIKNIDNTNPTDNPDIRYSLSDTGNTGSLMAMHSLNENNLKNIMTLGGIPAASIAVADTNNASVLNEFGGDNGYTLLFDKSSIDPKNKKNEVYNRDVYSKTVPTIYQKVDNRKLKNTLNEFRRYESEYGSFNKHDYSKSSLESIVNDLKYATAVKAKFLEDNGYNIDKVYRNYKSSYGFTEEVINKFIQDYPELAAFNPAAAEYTYEVTDKAPQIKQIAIDMMAESDPEISKKSYEELFKDDWYLQDVMDFYRDINGYRRLNGQKEFDMYATRDNIDKAVDEHQEEFENWLKDKFEPLYGEKYFENETGTRKYDYTLENLTSYMTKGNTKAQQKGMFDTFSVGQAKAGAAQKYNTLEEIKEASKNLVDAKTYKERHEAFETLDESVRDVITDERLNNGEDLFDVYSDYYMALSKAASGVNPVRALENNYFNNMSHDQIDKFAEVANALKNLPAKYFEAKPQRAINLNEIKGIAAPITGSESFKEQLRKNGYEVIEYDPSIEGDRERVINQFDDLKFSLSNGQEQTELAKGSYNVPMKDYLVQKEPIQQVNDSINQLADKITQLQEQLNELGRPTQLSDEKAITEQYAEAPTSEEAPIRENMTQSQSEELDFLEDYFKDYMKNNDIKNESELATEMSTNFATDADKQLYSMYKELKDIENGAFEEQVADDEVVSRGLSDRELGKRKVKAYQYEHPEVKPYFQEQAKALLSELNESTFGERTFDSETYYNTDGELGWNGTKRDTSESLAKFKDSNNYTWEEIRQGLEDIINDNGAENNAVSKKLELVIDDRLRNGYKNFGLDAMYMGDRTPANREYINLLNNIQMEEAFSNIPMSEVDTSEDITEGNDLSQAVHGTANEIKKLELALAMKNAKGLDETIQKNVDKLEEKITKPDNLMDMFYPESRKPINQAPERPTITKTPVRKLIDNLKGMFVNENVEIDNLAKEYKRPDIKWAGDMLNNAFVEGQNDVTVAQTDNQGNAIGKSVNQLFQPAINEGLYDAFNDYLINYSNIDRHNNGKGSKTPLNVSQNLVKAYEESYPQFKEWGKDVWNYGKNTRDNMLEAGLIDQNFHDLLGEMYPHYVPYISDVENINNYMQDVGEIKPRGIKKAYGKAGKLLPVQEALTKYTFSMKKGIRQNALYNKIVDTLRGGQEAQLATDDRTDYTNLDNGIYHDKNGAYLTAYENGIARNVRISEDLYNGLKNDLKNQVKNLEEKLSLITNPLQKFSNIRRNVLTSWSPTFPIKNAIKDFQGALFNSKHTAKMLKNYPGAIKELSTMSSPQVKQFVALYGSGNLMGQFDEGSYKSLGKNKFLRGISKANEVIELAPRYAEFKASIENGATLEEAMYNAREVTTNFSRGGTITKALNRNGFTFLNSSVQGFDKFVRNFSGENGAKGVVSALLKATMFGVAPALFNDLVFGSGDDKDEDYEALPNYIKDNYYLIKTGDNKFVRIPKGREFSVFGSAARRALEAANGDENAFDGFLKNAWDQIGVGDLEQNNIIAPLLQAYGSKNGNAWYGGDIVPTRLQDKPAGEQTDSSIDAVSTWLGEKLGISPYKLNYVIDQYTGGVGDLLLPLITPEAKSEGGFFAPITDQFTSNSTMKNKYASDFYTKLDELKVKKNSSNATDEDALRYQYMSGISSEMGKLYTEKREIQASDLSKADKYAQVQEIQKQINELAKVGLEGYNNISAENNYAEVGDDMGYYKNSKGNWTAIPQTDIRETESIGLTDKEKSTYYQTKNSIYNITENYKEKSANATDEQKTILNAEKKRDIINQIQSSNLPDNGKAILYDKYYGSTDKINAVIDSEVKFDSYLDLQKQNFTADKDKNGKAINGTKKAKVFNYINSMNIPYIDKCILAKLEYKTFRDADRDIIEYLDKNPNITYDEMVDTLKAMGFEVNGNQVK